MTGRMPMSEAVRKAPRLVREAGGPTDVASPPVRPRKPVKEDVIVHVYDDIREADNVLPRWWLYTLYGAIAFAIGYWSIYQVWKSAPGPVEEYKRVMSAERKAEARRLKEAGPITAEKLIALSKNQEEVAEGKRIFDSTCVI